MMQLLATFSDHTGTSASQGLCYACSAAQKPEHPHVLSTGIYVDQEGTIELCVDCAEHIGTMVGGIAKAKADELRDNNRKYGRENAKYRLQVSSYARIRRAVDDIINGEPA